MNMNTMMMSMNLMIMIISILHEFAVSTVITTDSTIMIQYM